ncbi:phosphoribosylanthranilate isomerase [Methylovirgula sp. 4M-Z18]|uniref:phosphoribosylanthranilate isomerase n=1 Tax=Methylovirgula sp. 4M-Z18 TaxID=2293567 RepID=UPI000E2EEFE2|nr:phosphoribosylanthranilate isomerase [Methylovirgula sp. 4M-Z18]RFB79014.1 phosphoribosylanthranilate isomerase [Methylovirgula sp. 4M-Z18]
MSMLIKICGLSTEETLEAALQAGADMIGFNFVAKSPRYISLETARRLGAKVRGRARKAALLVDADDAAIGATIDALGADILQLHGKETPERVRAVASRFGLPVMKAVGVATRDDVRAIAGYRGMADHILIDAKPPKDAAYPGGHGKVFDWTILEALDPGLSFMLSGGLSPANVAEAIKRVRPWAVDVSSGVESVPGVKDVAKIRAFIAAARDAAKV